MNVNGCETVRDLLPSLVRGELLPQESVAAQAHVAGCAACRDELQVVRLIQATLDPLPPGLETRVLSAVRRAPRAGLRPARRWAPARLAMAATLAAAVLGGSLVLQRFGTPWEDDGWRDDDVEPGSLLSWVASEDLMLHSGTILEELTVDELELLLEELDS